MITVVGGILIMYYAWHKLEVGEIHVPGAGFLPFLVGAALAILGVIWALMSQETTKQEGEFPAENHRWQRPVLSFILMVIYAWTIETLGYITSTLIFMVTWQKVIEREKWFKTALISLIGTFSIYTLFLYFLKVPLPKELFLR